MTLSATARRIGGALAAAGIVLGLAAVTAQAETGRPVVRDHRTQPIIRDHRKPLFCFGGITGGVTCYPG